jgi:hypothetical protein
MRKLGTAVMAAVLLSLGTFATASAGAPTVVYLPPVSFDDPYVCGGDPVIHVAYSGAFRLAVYSDRNGNLVRDAITPGGQVTVTFSANGTSLTSSSPAPFRTTYNADGAVAQVTAVGLNAAIRIPGAGTVLLDAGAVVWDLAFGGNVASAAGPHEWFIGGDSSAFCAYFG